MIAIDPDKRKLTVDEFSAFTTALLEILMRKGVINADMIKQAGMIAEAILVDRDTTLATMFHHHAPLRTKPAPSPSLHRRLWSWFR